QALRRAERTCAELRQPLAAVDRYVSFKRVIDDGNPKIAGPKHRKEYVGRSEIELRLEPPERPCAVLLGYVESVHREQHVLAVPQGSQLGRLDRLQSQGNGRRIAAKDAGIHNRAADVLRPEIQVKGHADQRFRVLTADTAAARAVDMSLAIGASGVATAPT